MALDMLTGSLGASASLGANLTQGYSSGGSVNSAKSQSYSHTYGKEASATGATQAALANNTAMANWEKAAEYNAEQARIQREWQERMANTVYQRSVEDMKKAGINPILAANMGLGTASVGSGATASMSDANAFMGQTFAEQNSASRSQSSGSSWQNSESGISTLARDLGEVASNLWNAANSSQTFNIAIEGIKDSVGEAKNWLNEKANSLYEATVVKPAQKIKQGIDTIKNIFGKK